MHVYPLKLNIYAFTSKFSSDMLLQEALVNRDFARVAELADALG